MSHTAHKIVAKKASGRKSKAVKRSALTGRFVLRPVLKRGTISIRDANTAVQAISNNK